MATRVRPPPPDRGRQTDAGATLIEILVALAIFALIGTAGFSVLDQIVKVQDHTEARLDQLSRTQRAAHLVSQDFMTARAGSLAFAEGGVSFRRGGAGADMAVRYGLESGALVRGVSGLGIGAPVARQPLLANISAIRWSFLDAAGTWQDRWPPRASVSRAGGAASTPLVPGLGLGAPRAVNPRAVALELTLAGPGLSGTLRRVATLPEDLAR